MTSMTMTVIAKAKGRVHFLATYIMNPPPASMQGLSHVRSYDGPWRKMTEFGLVKWVMLRREKRIKMTMSLYQRLAG